MLHGGKSHIKKEHFDIFKHNILHKPHFFSKFATVKV